MVQQQVENKWQHFVGVSCLNLTTRQQVKRVHPTFFKLWPTPEIFIDAEEDDVKEVIKSLGMMNVRTTRLYRMTQD